MKCGLDILAEHLGVNRVEEVTYALMMASPPQLATAASALWDYDRNGTRRLNRRLFRPEFQKLPGELRPFVGEKALKLSYMPKDLAGAHAAAEAILVRLQHSLLYAHSVAAEEPIPEQEPSLDEQRLALVSYAVLMTYIYPLVAANVVVLTEPEIHWFQCGPKYAPMLWDNCSGDQLEQLEIASAGHPDPISRIDQLVDDLFRMQVFDGRVDLYLHDPVERNLLAWIFDNNQTSVTPQRDLVLPETIADDELLVVQTLLSTTVPGVADLCPQDLVEIRQSDEAFAAWRGALRSGVAAALALPSILDRQGGVLRHVRSEIESEAAHLVRTFGQSKFFADRASGVHDFGVQALIGASTGASIASLAIAGANTGSKMALSAVLNRRKPAEVAFQGHVQALLKRDPL